MDTETMERIPLSNQRRLMPLLWLVVIESFAFFIVVPVFLELVITPQKSALIQWILNLTGNNFFALISLLGIVGYTITTPILATLSDYFSRKSILIICISFAVVGSIFSFIGIKTNLILLILIGRLMSGTANASQVVAQAATADFSGGKIKAIRFSLIASMILLGLIFGPTLGSLLIDKRLAPWLGLSIPYYISALLSIANIALIGMFYFDDKQTRLVVKQRSYFRRCLGFMKNLHLQRIFGLLTAMLLLETAWGLFYQVAPLYLANHFNYNNNRMLTYLGFLGVWMLFGLIAIYRIAMRFFSIEKYLMLTLLVAFLSLIGMNFAHYDQILWIFGVPLAMAVGSSVVSIVTLVSERADRTHQGLTLGLAALALGLGWILSGALSGHLYHHSTQSPFFAATIIMLFAVLSIPAWRRIKFNDDKTIS